MFFKRKTSSADQGLFWGGFPKIARGEVNIMAKIKIMETVIIVSTEENVKKSDMSQLWKAEHRYHKKDVTEAMLANGKQWYEYHVQFNGVIPVQLTKTNKLRKPLVAK